LIAELLACPMVADESIWKHVDHAIVAISGTRDLGLSDVQEMVSTLKDHLPVNIPIATSASLDEESHDKVRVSVLFAMTAPVTVVAAEKRTEGQPAVAAKKARALKETTQLTPPPAKAELEPPITQPLPKPRPTRAPVATTTKPKPAPMPTETQALAQEPMVPTVPPETEQPVASIPAKATVRTGGRFVAKQEEMQFESPTRGRFEKTHETMYRGENLDQPTFRRRGLKIKI